MALNASSLSAAIKANLMTEFGLPPDKEPDDMEKLCKAIADAVVSHITANATVVGSVTVAVATGKGAIDPGTGKII